MLYQLSTFNINLLNLELRVFLEVRPRALSRHWELRGEFGIFQVAHGRFMKTRRIGASVYQISLNNVCYIGTK